MNHARTEPEAHYTIRHADEGDVAMIFHSWLKSFRMSAFAKQIPNDIYFEAHHTILRGLVARSLVQCAVSDEDERQVYGWICAELSKDFPVLHYVYVKLPYRRFGIARKLMEILPSPEFYYSHKTELGEKFMGRRAVYNPYRMFGSGS